MGIIQHWGDGGGTTQPIIYNKATTNSEAMFYLQPTGVTVEQRVLYSGSNLRRWLAKMGFGTRAQGSLKRQYWLIVHVVYSRY
jgi:hypothetical protein